MALMSTRALEQGFQSPASSIGRAFVDRDLCCVDIDETFALITGITIDESLGRLFSEVAPAFAPMLEPLLRQALATGEPISGVKVQEATRVGAEPQRTWLVELDPVHTRSGLVLGVDIAVQSIAARHAATSPPVSMKQALALLNMLVASAPIGLAFVDRELRFVLINERLAMINDLSIADHIGRTASELFSDQGRLWENIGAA